MTPGKGGVFSLSVAIFAAGALMLGPPQTARAEGIIKSFFTSLGHVLQAAPPRLPERVPTYAEPSQRIDRIERAITPPTERVDSGPAKAFCVRTCDGHYFPVRAHAGMSTAQVCRSFCPASQTRLFSGRTIDYAVARDGSRYANLATANAYRRHVVVGCTCNGRDQLGLAHVEAGNDPTLRPGDVVATRAGMVVFIGRKDGAADFKAVVSYSHFSKSYRDQLAGMRIMPPNPGAPPEASIVPLPEQAYDDNPRSAQS
jgi:hypothetical protein